MARIIDTHCHVGLHKYEPLESLTYHMNRAGVEGAVFIQYMGNTDNSYLVECLKRHPGRFAAAMIVPKDDDGRAIRAWAEQGIGGIRLGANSRAAGADPLAQWRTASELSLVVSASCSVQSLLSDEFAEVIAAFPKLSIVIEHLAGAKRDMQAPYAEFKQVMALARFSNLTIKLPGFGEFCDLTALFHGALEENQANLDAALANRAHGRLTVGIVGDGDYMMQPGVIWTAAHHQIPLLMIVHNNRGYHQEVMHVQRMANRNNRGIDRTDIGTTIKDPNMDYAAMAKSMGVYGEGPISEANEIGPAIRRALAVVRNGEPALIDAVMQPR